MAGIMLQDPNAPKHEGDLPILDIDVDSSDIQQSQFFEDIQNNCYNEIKEWTNNSKNKLYVRNKNKYTNQEIKEAQDWINQEVCYIEYDDNSQEQMVIDFIQNIINGLKELAEKRATYMSGNFADWSQYYDRRPMNNAKDVIDATYEALYALGTSDFYYNYTQRLDELLYSLVQQDVDNIENENVIEIIEEEFGI